MVRLPLRHCGKDILTEFDEVKAERIVNHGVVTVYRPWREK